MKQRGLGKTDNASGINEIRIRTKQECALNKLSDAGSYV